MALTSTVYNFEIKLSDNDRQVYESLSLRVACHPSEKEENLVTRVLAYCLEYTEGIAFSKGGLSNPDEPAITVRDLTGAMTAWIEVGAPTAERLHKASKTAPRVAVYIHRDPATLLRQWSEETIFRGEELALYAVDRKLIADLVAKLERRNTFEMSVSDSEVYIDLAGETLSGPVTRLTLG